MAQTEIVELLSARGKQHGPFEKHAAFSQALKRAMQDPTGNWPSLSEIQREALEMIQHKVGRILAGDANHKDHWDDICGYAKLVSDRIGR